MTDETIFDDKNTHEMNTNQLTAYRIKEERLRLNYSQQAVADYLSMDISNYSRLENGKLEITISKLEAIAEFFKIPIVNLLPSNLLSTVNINNGTALINGNGTISNTSFDQNISHEFMEKLIMVLQKIKNEI